MTKENTKKDNSKTILDKVKTEIKKVNEEKNRPIRVNALIGNFEFAVMP